MKKRSALLLLVLVLAACRSSGSTTMTGASSPENALERFLAAAKAQDLQAMGSVWGTEEGPARDKYPRAEVEMRELTMIRLLCQDSARITGKTQGMQGTQVLRVEMKRAAKTEMINFTTVRGPSDRWYVFDFEIEKIQLLCR